MSEGWVEVKPPANRVVQEGVTPPPQWPGCGIVAKWGCAIYIVSILAGGCIDFVTGKTTRKPIAAVTASAPAVSPSSATAPKRYPLKVSVQPSNAVVMVDLEGATGPTATFELAPGEHQLKVSWQGYKTHIQTVVIPKNKNISVVLQVDKEALERAREAKEQAMMEKLQQEVAEEVRREAAHREAHPLELLSSGWEYEEYATYVAGKIRNNTDREYSYVQVGVTLLDDAGNVTGSTMANVNGLRSGETWKFRALIYNNSDQIRRYRISESDITGW